MTGQIVIGDNVKVLPKHESIMFNKVIKHYSVSNNDPMDSGQGREDYTLWVLSLFNNLEAIPCVKGSQLDLMEVDILIRSDKGDIPLQVKSSLCGVQTFLSKNSRAKDMLVLWVDTLDANSKKRLFYLLLPVLQSMGFSLKKQVKETLNFKRELENRNIKQLNINTLKTIPNGLEKMNILLKLGIVNRRSDVYVL